MPYDPVDFRTAFVALLRTTLGNDGCGSGRPPDVGPFPYVSISWDISEGRVLDGDGATVRTRREIQLSLFEKAEEEDGSEALALMTLVDGAKLEGVRVGFSGSSRAEDPDRADLIHTTMTLSAQWVG